MIERYNSTHARNHRKLRQAHIEKIVRNEDAFAQRFRTAKGIRTRFFFFGSGAIAAHSPKTRKSESGSILGKHSTEDLQGKNIWSVPTFLRVRTLFFL